MSEIDQKITEITMIRACADEISSSKGDRAGLRRQGNELTARSASVRRSLIQLVAITMSEMSGLTSENSMVQSSGQAAGQSSAEAGKGGQ